VDMWFHFQLSSQINIIIYNNTIPVLFSEGDFVVTTSKNMEGIIEVKTKIRSNELQNIIQKSESNGKLICGRSHLSNFLSGEF
jgi:hypothetical protein